MIPDEKEPELEPDPTTVKPAVPRHRSPADSPPPELSKAVFAEMGLPEKPPSPPSPPEPEAKPESHKRAWLLLLVVLAVVGCLCATAVTAILPMFNTDPPSVETNATRVESPTRVPFPFLSPEEAAAATAQAAPTPTRSPEGEALFQTRESIAATRAGQSATRQAVEGDGVTAVYGPANGAIPHDDDPNIETFFTDVNLRNFVARATILNPYAAEEQGWDFGFVFRLTEPGQEMRLVVRSDGRWNLNNRQGADDNFVQEDNFADLLNLGANETNELLLIAHEAVGYFFLNSQFISRLDLSARDEFGALALGTAFYGSHERPGAVTRYQALTVWPYEPVSQTAVGQLDHQNDGFIRMLGGNVNRRNFVAEATFIHPYPVAEGSWDWGFAFRERSDTRWLVIESDGDWSHIKRVSGGDTFLDQGSVTNLATGAEESNQLTLIALDDAAYFFVNGEYVAALDLSDWPQAGDLSLVAAFFEGNEIAGTSTGFRDFTIWPLP
jgi:hypothetical protein